MKLTRRQIRKLIQETSLLSDQQDDSPSEGEANESGQYKDKLFNLIKTGDQTQIKQARDLAESLGMDFKQLVEELVRRENPVETPEVDEVLQYVTVPLKNARTVALKKLGINIREILYSRQVDLEEDLDILEELQLTIRDRSQDAVELAVVQTIMKISQ